MHKRIVPFLFLCGLCGLLWGAKGAQPNPCGRVEIGDSVFNKNRRSRIGPRRLTFARLQGNLVGLFQRRWNTYIPVGGLDRVFLLLKKRGGSAKVKVTVCRHRNAQDPGHLLHQFVVPAGEKPVRRLFRKTLTGVKHAYISVKLKGMSAFGNLHYEIRLRRPNQGKLWQPRKVRRGPVSGFADLHNHHVAEMASGGGYMFGHHGKPLKACTGRNHGTFFGGKGGGKFRGPHPKQTQPYVWWPHYADGSHQQVGVKELMQAWRKGLRLLVATAVNSQPFCLMMSPHKQKHLRCDDMDSARLQLQAMHAFARRHPWYRIARDPWEARRIIHQGKLAVVLAIEVSNLFPESHGDWRDQLDELYDMGVRSFELAHMTDSRFVGSAHQRAGMLGSLNLLQRMDHIKSPKDFFQLFHSMRKPAFCRKKGAKFSCNKLGLKKERGVSLGAQLVHEMAKRHMLIPLDHISRKARSDVFRLASTKLHYYPLFASHSRFDALMHPAQRDHGGTEEYMLSDLDVSYIRQTGGVFGLRPGPELMREVPGCINKKLTCWGSSESLAQNLCWAARSGIAMAFGSDFNAGLIMMTAPRFSSTFAGTQRHDRLPAACPQNVGLGWVTPGGYLPRFRAFAPQSKGAKKWGYDVRGLAHVGYLRDALDDLKQLKAPTGATRFYHSAETFLRMWERTYTKRTATPLSAKAYRELMGTQQRTYPKPLAPVSFDKKLVKAYQQAMAQKPGQRMKTWKQLTKK